MSFFVVALVGALQPMGLSAVSDKTEKPATSWDTTKKLIYGTGALGLALAYANRKAIKAWWYNYDSFSIHTAAKLGQVEIVKYLVEEKKADIEAKDAQKQTALQIAAEKGYSDIVKYLVEKGADIEAKDDDKQTALHLAAEKGRSDIVKYLLEKGADVNAKTLFDRTVLLLAAEKGHSDIIIKYLVEKGADVNAKTPFDRTVLHLLVDKGDSDIIRYLVGKRVDVNAKTESGRTALQIAAKKIHSDIIKYLVEKGADIEAKDGNKQTALQIAAEKGHLDIIKYLVEKGADIEAKDVLEETALQLAARYDRSDVVKYLVEKGADIEAKDNDKRTALHLAARVRDRSDLVKYLVEKGADVKAKDTYDWTALQLAAGYGRSYVVKYLEFVEDFYRVVASKMVLNAFLKKYCESQEADKNKQNLVDLRNLLHLGTKELANEFYGWCKEKKKFAVGDKWDSSKVWMYFDLLKQSMGSQKELYQKQLYWLGIIFDVKYAQEDKALKEKITLFCKTSENQQLKKAYSEYVYKQNMGATALKKPEKKPSFDKRLLEDIKINFQK